MLECIAAPVAKGESVTVPVGKKVPLLGIKKSQVSIQANKSQITKMETSTIPIEWDLLATKISKERINHVEDVLTLGDVVKCKCLGKDKMGRIGFSIKDAN